MTAIDLFTLIFHRQNPALENQRADFLKRFPDNNVLMHAVLPAHYEFPNLDGFDDLFYLQSIRSPTLGEYKVLWPIGDWNESTERRAHIKGVHKPLMDALYERDKHEARIAHIAGIFKQFFFPGKPKAEVLKIARTIVESPRAEEKLKEYQDLIAAAGYDVKLSALVNNETK